jgi:hypothetical protein
MTHQARRAVLILAVVCLLAMGAVQNAAAQTASCTGNQTNTDIDSDQCQSISTSGGAATANATGPTSSTAFAEADGSTSSATSNATNDAEADSLAVDSSSATSTATDDSLSQVQAYFNATGNGNASDDGLAEVIAVDGGVADASASEAATAEAGAAGGAIALATATDDSVALASDSTPYTAVCAYAADGGFASGSDSAAPVCDPGPGVAVVVSPLGSCGPVAMSPCAAIPQPDAIVRLVNPNGGPDGLFSTEEHPVCAMIYVFDDDQEMQACCGCPVSSAGLLTLSSNRDLRANIIGESLIDPTLGWIDVVPARENAASSSGSGNNQGCFAEQSGACNGGCDPTSNPGYEVDAQDTLLGSISRSQFVSSQNPGNPTIGVTEVPLPIDQPRDPRNLTYEQAECGALVGNGSGAGTCHCPLEGAPR